MLLKILTIIFIIAVDQGVKYWAVTYLANSAFRPEIPGLIGLTYVQNTGAAFSILQNMRVFFLIITVIVVAVILYALFTGRVQSKLGQWALVMITGGALGNFIDRAFVGYVVDMFDLEFMNFAIFNVADSFITVGAVLFCIYMLFIHDKVPNGKAGASNDDAPTV
jgi:signal peptidase II